MGRKCRELEHWNVHCTCKGNVQCIDVEGADSKTTKQDNASKNKNIFGFKLRQTKCK